MPPSRGCLILSSFDFSKSTAVSTSMIPSSYSSEFIRKRGYFAGSPATSKLSGFKSRMATRLVRSHASKSSRLVMMPAIWGLFCSKRILWTYSVIVFRQAVTSSICLDKVSSMRRFNSFTRFSGRSASLTLTAFPAKWTRNQV